MGTANEPCLPKRDGRCSGQPSGSRRMVGALKSVDTGTAWKRSRLSPNRVPCGFDHAVRILPQR